MKKSIFFLASFFVTIMLLASANPTTQSIQSADVLFGNALHQEEVEGDYEAAIKTYEKLLAEYPDNRPLAARAQFRIGVCYEKLGFEEAEKAFQTVIDNYPDQTEAVKMAKEKLSLLERARAIVEKEDQGIKMTEIPLNWDKVDLTFISPDAKKVAYASKDRDIWIMDIASGKEFQLTKTETREFWCIWSPDSQQIAIQDGDASVYVASLKGGTPKVLIKKDEDFDKKYPEFTKITPVSWSSDCQKIYCRFGKKGLFAVPINGEDWETVYEYTSPDPGESEAFMSISPNEKFLSYCQYRSDGDIYVIPVNGGEPARITDHPGADVVPRWSYDSRWLLFLSTRTGGQEPWIVGISPDGKREGEPFQVQGMTKADYSLLNWLKGNKMTMPYGWSTSHLFVANADGSDEVQLTKMEWRYWIPRWSPDNKYIAFGASQATTGDIYVIPVQGGAPKTISEDLFANYEIGNIRDLRWHPSGRMVSLVTITLDRGIWTIDIESGAVQKIPFDYSARIAYMDWSPDGKWIVFDYTGNGDINDIQDSDTYYRNIYTMPAEGGEPVRITRVKEEGFHQPLWSPDGRNIAFLDTVGRIWVGDSEGGEPHPITDKTEGSDYLVTWSPDGANIYFVRSEEQQYVYYSVSYKDGELRKMDLDGMMGLDFSPDGKRMVYNKPMKQIRQLWLLENFLPEKKKD